jgi:hypothetical protein
MLAVDAPTRVETVLARLDVWLDTMRGDGGYAGPVVHWWQQCLLAVGPALDWRYEGIIAGYLRLWERTGEERWLAKARRAGDDLVAGQLPDGHFAASAFELNPATAGTPHEAACDVGLLLLAGALRRAEHAGWEAYLACARRNLRAFYLGKLWDARLRAFRDSPSFPSFVPNKAATACEALFLLSELTGDDAWVERYVLPTLERLLDHQVGGSGRLAGAIAQNSLGTTRVDKYFPIYIARCVPALACAHAWTGQERYAAAGLAAMRFIASWLEADGSLPTVIYPNRRVNRSPSWIAPLGDILRAADLARPWGFDADLSAMHQRLLAGADTTGGIQTAAGFATQAGGRRSRLPDLRDLLRVAGWCDKSFRYLADQVGTELPPAEAGGLELPCTFQGVTLRLCETPEIIEVFQGSTPVYRWRKGAAWPEIASPLFWLR